MEFLEYLPQIVIGLIILAGAIIYIVRFIKASPEEKRKIIGEILYALALKAEAEYKSQTGVAKKKQVVAWFYEKYPALVYVLSEAELSAYIDEIVEQMNLWLKSNPVAQVNIIGEVIVEPDPVEPEPVEDIVNESDA